MTDASLSGANGVGYYGHGICRTRSGRLYAGCSIQNLLIWRPLYTYSNDNGATWSTPATITGQRNYQENGVMMAVDNGDNVHAVWRDTTNDQIWYSRLNSPWLGWTTPEVIISSIGGDPQTPKIVVDTNNYIVVLSGRGTTASEQVYLTAWSKDSGVTWLGSTSVRTVAGPFGLCADNSGKVHAVWSKSDGARQQIEYANFDAGTGSWSAVTPITNDTAGDSQEADIVIDYNENRHVTWVGRATGDSGFLSLGYNRYDGISWQGAAMLSDETVADARFSACGAYYDPSTGTVRIHCGYRGWDATPSQYEIIETHADGPDFNSWSGLTTISDTTIANNKSYPGFAYQRFPMHSMPATGYGVNYLVETSTEVRYVTSPATWNPWYPWKWIINGVVSVR